MKPRFVKLLGSDKMFSLKLEPRVVEPVHFYTHGVRAKKSATSGVQNTNLVFLDDFSEGDDLGIDEPREGLNISSAA
jgi:hypothetical protein